MSRYSRATRNAVDTYHAWTHEWMTFPNGAHVAKVEIHRETAPVTLAHYTAVDDYGVLVNPMMAAGQAHGAIAQGVGQALLKHAVYDSASGQLVAGSLIDYALPRRRSPVIRCRLQRHALHDPSARRQRLRRGRRRGRLPGR
jgi:aerobic carbon-monoxide dehydrogenase large subunit